MFPLGVFALSIACGCSLNQTSPSASQFGACDPLPCLTVSISTISEEWLEAISKDSRQRINEEIGRVLYNGGESTLSDKLSLESLREELIKRLSDEFEANKNETTLWRVTRNISTLFENSGIVTVQVISEGYLGGAHDFSDKTFLTFNKKTGERIKLDHLVAPYSKQVLSSIAAIEFRRTFNIPLGKTLEEEGFTVRNSGDFPIPDNLGIVEKGLLVHFNPYEIAPYSRGSFDFMIPIEALEPVLRGGDSTSNPLRHYFDPKGGDTAPAATNSD